MLDTGSVEVSQWLLPGCSRLAVFPLSLPHWRWWRGSDLSPGLMMDFSTSWTSTRGSTADWWNTTLGTSTLLSNTKTPTTSTSWFSHRNPAAAAAAHNQVRRSDAPSVERSWPPAITLSTTQLESFLSGPGVNSAPAIIVGKGSLWRIYLCWLRTLNVSPIPGSESTSWIVNIALTRLATGAFLPVAVEEEEAEASG